jgi:hypothetical protein
MVYGDITAFTVAGGSLFTALYSDNIYRYRLSANSSVRQKEVGYEIHLYPNPSRATLHIEGVLPDERVNIYDALGRLVLETRIGGEREIDVHALPQDSYTVTFSTSRPQRFVK